MIVFDTNTGQEVHTKERKDSEAVINDLLTDAATVRSNTIEKLFKKIEHYSAELAALLASDMPNPVRIRRLQQIISNLSALKVRELSRTKQRLSAQRTHQR